jgi:hypothetical protein
MARSSGGNRHVDQAFQHHARRACRSGGIRRGDLHRAALRQCRAGPARRQRSRLQPLRQRSRCARRGTRPVRRRLQRLPWHRRHRFGTWSLAGHRQFPAWRSGHRPVPDHSRRRARHRHARLHRPAGRQCLAPGHLYKEPVGPGRSARNRHRQRHGGPRPVLRRGRLHQLP